MTQPNPPPQSQVPLSSQVAALGQQPQPQPPPVATAPTVPQHPYMVIVTDSNKIEHQLPVTRASLKLTRDGVNPARGSIELEAQVHSRPDVASLLSVANMPGQYSITLRYFAPDGTIVRNDVVAVNATSLAEYTGPQLEQGKESWTFIEKLTIHA